MLDIQFIKDNADIVRSAIQNKKGENVDLDKLFALNEDRIFLIKKIDEFNGYKNEAAKEKDHERGAEVKVKLKGLEAEFEGIQKEFISLLSKIPNIPSADTPVGVDEESNQVLRSWGDKREFTFSPRPHWELGDMLGVIDSERATKTAGSRFSYLKGDLVHIQFALINFCLSVLTDKSVLEEIIRENNLTVSSNTFTPVVPPALVKPEILFAMGRLDPKEDKFFIEKDNLYLSGSAEHLLGSLHTKEKLAEEDLPLRYVGYSTAFRREAGSYGKDTKGILRQHQFDKLEMETFCSPETSIQEQDFLVAIQEYIMKKLNLPHQVVIVCTGDMGKPDYRQIDIDTWMPGQDVYRETHSADCTSTYQSRRLNIKIDRKSKDYVHMNDATAIAVGRVLIAIMENYQNEDGSIDVPEVLKKYTHIETIKKCSGKS